MICVDIKDIDSNNLDDIGVEILDLIYIGYTILGADADRQVISLENRPCADKKIVSDTFIKNRSYLEYMMNKAANGEIYSTVPQQQKLNATIQYKQDAAIVARNLITSMLSGYIPTSFECSVYNTIRTITIVLEYNSGEDAENILKPHDKFEDIMKMLHQYFYNSKEVY